MQLLKSNEYVKVDGDRFDVLKFILSLFVVGLIDLMTDMNVGFDAQVMFAETKKVLPLSPQ